MVHRHIMLHCTFFFISSPCIIFIHKRFKRLSLSYSYMFITIWVLVLWLGVFFSNGCPHCKMLTKNWYKTMARKWSDELKSNTVDTNQNPIELFHQKLMGPWNKAKFICMVELLSNILPKCVHCSSWRYPSSIRISHPGFQVRPRKITHMGPSCGIYIHFEEKH
jgi:hypothetical protein